MNKLFLATSFSGKVDYDTGLVLPNFKSEIENVLECLRNIGRFSVFCAIEHEGWRIGDEPPEAGVQKDIAEIDASDGVLALVHDAPSAGVQWETGYTRGTGKKLFLAAEPDHIPAYFNQGVINLGWAHRVVYDSPESLALQVREGWED
jgi:nucleoside 2-deoxyribosyltransferase